MRSNFVFKIHGKHGVFGLDGLQKFGERLPQSTPIEVFDAKTGARIINMRLSEVAIKFR